MDNAAWNLAHLDLVKEYADIVRGERPGWDGDRVRNGESFAWRIGYDYPGDAPALIQSLRDAEREYSLLSGLSPTSIKQIALYIRDGMREALRQAKRDGRG